MNVYFEFKKKEPKAKDGLLRCVIIDAGKREFIPTGIKLESKNWNAGKVKTISATGNIRLELKKYEAAFGEYIRKTVTGFNEVPSLTDAKIFIVSKINGINTERGKKDIESLMQVYFDERANKFSDATKKEYRTMLRHLLDYNPNVQFSEFNFAWGEKWMRWLSEKGTKTPKDKKVKNIQSVTINKLLSSLKTFCRWAIKNKHTSSIGSEDIEMIKIVSQRIITLTQDELNLYANFDFSSKEHLGEQRDLFCFVSYTGLRYEDLKKVEESVKKVNGEYILHLNTQKGNKELKMQLIPQAVAILKKYDLKLPLISDQKTNENIKAGVKMAGITRKETVVEQYLNVVTYPKKFVYEVISIHDARKTFTTLLLEAGLTITEVMGYTTHKDYRSMRPYINLEQKKTDAKLQLVFK